MLAVISFILILSFLVIIHELGHFLVAKWSKVGVEEFGIGYPPKIFKLFRFWDVDFTLNAIPFGGFVRLQGEDAEPGTKPKPGDYRAASLPKRLAVILAGAFVNFVFGIALFAVIFTKIGIPTEITTPRIGEISPGSPAAEAQLKPGWEIARIQAGDQVYQIEDTRQVVQVVKAHAGETVKLTLTGPCEGITCKNQTKGVEVYVRKPEEVPAGQGAIGLVFEPVVYVHYPIWQMPFRGMWVGTKQALALSQLIIYALRDMVVQLVSQRQLSSDLAGPVGIVHQAQSSGLFNQGAVAILSFVAMLSINLAIMNVLPIPPLDGGRAVLAVVEVALGKATAHKLEYYLNYGGWIAMMLLIIAITARDVWRIFR